MRTNTSGGRLTRNRFPPAFVAALAGLLALLDCATLLVAAYVVDRSYSAWLTPVESGGARYLLVVTALLASALLYDRRFGSLARRARDFSLVRYYLTRYSLFVCGVIVIGGASGALRTMPPFAVALWLGLTFVLTSSTRVVLRSGVRQFGRNGALADVVAIVGAGSLADRLTRDLRNAKGARMQILGVFDDDVTTAASGRSSVAGTIDDLIHLGKTRHLDWIFLNLPCANERQLAAVVRRLKALSVPIALCPWNVGLETPYQLIDYVGGALPVTVLVGRPAKRWRALIQLSCQFLPRWITTLLLLQLSLPVAAWQRGRERLCALMAPSDGLRCELDGYDLASFSDVAKAFGQARYGFVVTPNVDHLIRLHDDARFRELYAAARYVLLDSRFLAKLRRVMTGSRLPVCTGSDLTAKLFADVIASGDRIVLVGGSERQAAELRKRYALTNLVQSSPPMGFIHDPRAVEKCLRFVEAHSPFRFCLLAVGAPQQEILAERLQVRNVARGLALCVGASVDFITGTQRRAPRWLQRAGLEWLFRLAQNPARMAGRYLVRGPRVFGLLRKTTFVLRVQSAECVPQAA
jgi:exopolysaccharide biosynthesis WecB/TagA/CpsF family protein